MSAGAAPRHRGRDLDDRGEIAELVVRFYRELAQDVRFHRYFVELAHVDWDVHVRDLTDFWCGVLLGAPDRDAVRVLEAHRWLHEASPFDAELFRAWLGTFEEVLDGGWSGPVAERARRRAHGFAWAMAKRLTGADIGASGLVGR